jgi:hypothetical protein
MSFALVLLLFMLGTFPINSGALPKGGCYEVAGDGGGG